MKPMFEAQGLAREPFPGEAPANAMAFRIGLLGDE
jgi:hypothetical protein